MCESAVLPSPHAYHHHHNDDDSDAAAAADSATGEKENRATLPLGCRPRRFWRKICSFGEASKQSYSDRFKGSIKLFRWVGGG